MMRRGPILTIFRKELRETLRDRRTLVAMFLLPMLLYPLLAYVGIAFGKAELERAAESVSRVSLVGVPLPGLSERIDGDAKLSLVAEPAEGDAASGAADVEVHVAEGADVIDRDGTATVEVRWDATKETSRVARDRMEALLLAWSEELAAQRLEARGLSPDLIRPVAVSSRSTAPPERVGGSVMGRIVPLMLLLMVMVGAFYPAIDLTVGEKERGTLETLLAAPVVPTEVVAGKFLAVSVLAVAAGTVNLLAIGLTGWAIISQAQAVGAELSIAISPGVLAILGASLVLVALFFAALMMAVATPARTLKEAQAYVTPVYLVCMLPGFAATLPGVELSYATALVPVLGVAILVKALLVGEAAVGAVAVALVAAGVYAAVALLVAARLFGREAVLFGVPDDPWARERRAGQAPADVARPQRLEAIWTSAPGTQLPPRSDGEAPADARVDRPAEDPGRLGPLRKRPALSPTEGYLLVLTTVVLLVTAGGLLQAALGLTGFLITEWVLLLVPVLLAVKFLDVEPRTALNLGRLDGWAVAGAVMVGCTAWYPALLASFAAAPWLAPDPEVLEHLSKSVREPGSVWVTVLIFAATPAVCEELLFRGALLPALGRRHRAPIAILISAALFAAFHLSVFRMVPTFILGLAFGYAAWQARSVVASMICHALNNGLVVFVTELSPETEIPETLDTSQIPVSWPAGLVLLVGLGFGMYLLWRSGARRTKTGQGGALLTESGSGAGWG